MTKYDDNGNLVLSGKLGEAVVSGDFKAFTDALVSGKSEDGLSYQDMEDFNRFTNEFFRLGEFPDRDNLRRVVVLRKQDQAPFGTFGDPETDNLDSPLGGPSKSVFWPCQPFIIQGYEPAE